MPETFMLLGVVCIIAAIVGGGFEAAGYKVPVIDSRARQLALGLFGVVLVLSVKWEDLRRFLGQIWPRSIQIEQVDIDPGRTENYSIKPGRGAIVIRWRSTTPRFDPRGLEYGIRVTVCPPSAVGECPWRQMGAGNVFEHEVNRPGVYEISFHNYSVNPKLNISADIEYAR